MSRRSITCAAVLCCALLSTWTYDASSPADIARLEAASSPPAQAQGEPIPLPPAWVEMMRRRSGLPDDPFNCLAPRRARDITRCNDLANDFARMKTDNFGIGEVDARSVNAAVQDMRYAEPIVRRLWADAFRSIKKTFVPPTVHYFGVAGTTREVARTRCPAVLDNAFFCPAEHAIFYDAIFMGRLLAAVAERTQTSGRYSVIAVFGHEMAHAAIAQLQLGYNKKDEELVADCFAGVTVKAVSDVEAGNSRATRILHEITPRAEGSTGLAVLGSLSVAGGNYGNAEERRRYYLTGFEDGGPACQPSLLTR
jgi:predicted metalloprotease